MVIQGGFDSLVYLYDAAGIKLQQKVWRDDTLRKTTDYIGEFIYETGEDSVRRLQLIQHEEGRLIYDDFDQEWDYQYHLKDHLGNTRLTFSTNPLNYSKTATFEDINLTDEKDYFDNIDTPNRVSHPLVTNTGKAARLNNLTPAGPYAILSVNKGDTVDLSVNAYYDGGSGYSNSLDSAGMVGALVDAFSSSPVLSEGGISTGQLEVGIGSVIGIFGVGGSSDDAVPGAYLNYMVFDRDMNYVGIAGFEQISSTANGAEELVQRNDIMIEQEGYLIAYLSNESNTSNYVYFDDFTVYHGKTNVVQADDYYPGGGFFNSYTRTASTAQRFKYQGKEWEEKTQLYDFDARMYDPYIWRTLTIDPLASEFYDQSPYSFQRNNPIRFIDPTGMAAEDWVEAEDGTIYWDDNATSQETTKAGETYLGKNVLVATHNRDANGNEEVNTATFELYTEDGSIVPSTGPVASIDGNTVPSDTEQFGTLAEGIYPARFQARASKPGENALIINEGGELPTVNGNPNKANSDNLTEVFFHRGNPYQESLKDSGGNPVWSHGCLTGGCGQGSLDRFNTFMENAQDFNGTLYLRSKPAPDFSIQSLMPKR